LVDEDDVDVLAFDELLEAVLDVRDGSVCKKTISALISLLKVTAETNCTTDI
jgi:hypothetical protein